VEETGSTLGKTQSCGGNRKYSEEKPQSCGGSTRGKSHRAATLNTDKLDHKVVSNTPHYCLETNSSIGIGKVKTFNFRSTKNL